MAARAAWLRLSGLDIASPGLTGQDQFLKWGRQRHPDVALRQIEVA